MILKDKIVLVVEDTYDDIQLVSTILEHSGIHVEVAHNGVDCLKRLENITPFMILTDLAMPDMDGWEMLKQLRHNPATQAIPVIAITAYYSVDVAQDAIRAGFDAYFAKPINPTTFVQSLENILEH